MKHNHRWIIVNKIRTRFCLNFVLLYWRHLFSTFFSCFSLDGCIWFVWCLLSAVYCWFIVLLLCDLLAAYWCDVLVTCVYVLCMCVWLQFDYNRAWIEQPENNCIMYSIHDIYHRRIGGANRGLIVVAYKNIPGNMILAIEDEDFTKFLTNDAIVQDFGKKIESDTPPQRLNNHQFVLAKNETTKRWYRCGYLDDVNDIDAGMCRVISIDWGFQFTTPKSNIRVSIQTVYRSDTDLLKILSGFYIYVYRMPEVMQFEINKIIFTFLN